MSLGSLIFAKKDKASVKANPPTNSKPADINNIKLAARFKQAINRSLIGKDVRPLKKVKINDEVLDKKKLGEVYADIARRKRKDVTFKDFKTYIEKSYKYKNDIEWKDKKKIIAWAKNNAQRILDKQKGGAVEPSLEERVDERLARKQEALGFINDAKFVSPKSQSVLGQSHKIPSENSLGIKNMQSGFKRGHSFNPSSLGYDSVKKSKPIPGGLTRLNGTGVAGKSGPGPTGGTVAPTPRKSFL
jgi:hypothetical protein